MSEAVEGIRVVALGTSVATSLATAYLADFGAEVVRVQTLGSEHTGDLEDSNVGPYHGEWNYWADFLDRNNKSVALGLAQDAGRQLVRKLIEKSDVFSTDLTDEALEVLSLSYSRISGVKPEIVYAACSCLGCHGPDVDIHNRGC